MLIRRTQAGHGRHDAFYRAQIAAILKFRQTRNDLKYWEDFDITDITTDKHIQGEKSEFEIAECARFREFEADDRSSTELCVII